MATVSNANEIAPYIEQEKAVMAIYIPQDFQDRLDQGEKAPVQIISDGRNTMVAGLVTGYAGPVSYTHLFYPEGGGQPWDTGTLNDAKVTSVRKKDGVIIHYTCLLYTSRCV